MFPKTLENIFKVFSYTQKTTQNQRNTLKITILNTKHTNNTKIHFHKSKQIEHVRKSEKNQTTHFSFISNFHISIICIFHIICHFLVNLCWFYSKNMDSGTPSKSSGRPKLHLKSAKWRQHVVNVIVPRRLRLCDPRNAKTCRSAEWIGPSFCSCSLLFCIPQL